MFATCKWNQLKVIFANLRLKKRLALNYWLSRALNGKHQQVLY